MARYGPGGTYWANKYRQDFPGAGPAVPIQSWQVWNEPNLKKYFTPGATTQAVGPKIRSAACASPTTRSRPGIRRPGSSSPECPASHADGSSTAWDFLDALYTVAGVKADFDVAALHPYGCNLDQTRTGINRFSASMKSHGDGLRRCG